MMNTDIEKWGKTLQFFVLTTKLTGLAVDRDGNVFRDLNLQNTNGLMEIIEHICGELKGAEEQDAKRKRVMTGGEKARAFFKAVAISLSIFIKIYLYFTML